MTRRIPAACLAAVAAAGALACGGGGGSTDTAGIVQFADVTANTLTFSCSRITHLAAPDSTYIHVHMVNTTAADVAVDSIGSFGVTQDATNQAFIGQSALSFTSLPHTPSPATLMARTGDLTINVAIPMNGLCATLTQKLEFRRVGLSLRVITPAGQFNSPSPLTVVMTVPNTDLLILPPPR